MGGGFEGAAWNTRAAASKGAARVQIQTHAGATQSACRRCRRVETTIKKKMMMRTAATSSRTTQGEESQKKRRNGFTLGLQELSCVAKTISSKTMSTALATFAALDLISANHMAGQFAEAKSLESVQVVETSMIQLSDDVKEPGAIVKDCRTDIPGEKPIYWITSKESPTLYAIDADGQLVHSPYPVQAKNVGLEELVFVHRSKGGQAEDFLVLADTGNNQFKNRSALRFIEVAPHVPDASSSATGESEPIDVAREISFQFPSAVTSVTEGNAPAPSSSFKIPIGLPKSSVQLEYPQEDYLTSAIVFHNKTLWVFSQRKVGASTALYRLPTENLSPSSLSESNKEVYKLEFVQEFSSGSPVTGADVSNDGKTLAVLTKQTVFLFDLTSEASQGNPLAKLIGRAPLPSGVSGIALTWDNPQTMLVLDEGKQLTRIRIA